MKNADLFIEQAVSLTSPTQKQTAAVVVDDVAHIYMNTPANPSVKPARTTLLPSSVIYGAPPSAATAGRNDAGTMMKPTMQTTLDHYDILAGP